jgi:hypothetical protein
MAEPPQSRFVKLDQHLSDLTDGGLVLAVMTEENIEDLRFGVLSVHPEAILWKTSVEDNATSSPQTSAFESR